MQWANENKAIPNIARNTMRYTAGMVPRCEVYNVSGSLVQSSWVFSAFSEL